MNIVYRLAYLLSALLAPTLIAKEPTIVAHRGASAYAPENTLPAFELAWEMGADAIEGDFYLTSDGEIVCVHNANVLDYTGVDRVVSEATLAELRQLDFAAKRNERGTGVGISTLAEVMATVPDGKRLYIEVKCGPEIVPSMLAVIVASDLELSQIVVIAFDSAVIAATKKAEPQLEANWLETVELRESELEPSLESLLDTLEQCDADGLSAKANEAVDQAFVKSILQSGHGFHVWTVDDSVQAKRLASWGVQSITTNRPDRLLAAFED